MPTYEYECADCGHTFEEFQRMLAEQLKVCPNCSKQSLRRKIGSGAAVIFKGSGFFATDYGKKSEKKSESDQCQTGE